MIPKARRILNLFMKRPSLLIKFGLSPKYAQALPVFEKYLEYSKMVMFLIGLLTYQFLCNPWYCLIAKAIQFTAS